MKRVAVIQAAPSAQPIEVTRKSELKRLPCRREQLAGRAFPPERDFDRGERVRDTAGVRIGRTEQHGEKGPQQRLPVLHQPVARQCQRMSLRRADLFEFRIETLLRRHDQDRGRYPCLVEFIQQVDRPLGVGSAAPFARRRRKFGIEHEQRPFRQFHPVSRVLRARHTLRRKRRQRGVDRAHSNQMLLQRLEQSRVSRRDRNLTTHRGVPPGGSWKTNAVFVSPEGGP